MNLYELTGEYARLQALLDDAQTEEDTAEIYDAINEVGGDYVAKADGYARMMRNKAAEAEALKVEIDRLTARKRAAENASKWFKERMKESMAQLGINRIDTSIGTWSLKQMPPACEVTDIALVPEQFRKPIEVPYTVDKAAVKAWFKETGEIVPGTEIKRGEGVVFK